MLCPIHSYSQLNWTVQYSKNFTRISNVEILFADIDECASSPCQNGGTCVDGINSYSCNCNAGYTGDNCETDIDECASSPCQNGGTCTDGINSYTCNCIPGHAGDNCEIGDMSTILQNRNDIH